MSSFNLHRCFILNTALVLEIIQVLLIHQQYITIYYREGLYFDLLVLFYVIFEP